jgi:hypothetical protein
MPQNITINTARSEQAINAAAADGFRPLLRPVKPSPEIRAKYAVLQDDVSGAITVIHDYRLDIVPPGSQKVIDFTFYYPYRFESPFAAYLIPPDIRVGEVVFLDDLIEDIVGSSWNQADTCRLKESLAIWDGSDLIIQFDDSTPHAMIIG